MEESIIYLQSDSDVADSMRKRFEEDEGEFIICQNATETLEMLKVREFSLLLVDEIISDMRMIEFISEVSENYPNMKINVCTSTTDVTQLNELMRIDSVRKIFLSPYEWDEVEDGIRDSIDAGRLYNSRKKREEAYDNKKIEFNNMVEDISSLMNKQKEGYSIMSAILNPLRDAVLSQVISVQDENYMNFVTVSCEKYLRLNTLGSLEADNFCETIKKEINDLFLRTPHLKLEDLDIRFNSDVSRHKLANIRMAIWIISRLSMITVKNGDVSIKSEYLSASDFRISLLIKGRVMPDDYLPKYREYVYGVLEHVCKTYKLTKSEDGIRYELDFED